MSFGALGFKVLEGFRGLGTSKLSVHCVLRHAVSLFCPYLTCKFPFGQVVVCEGSTRYSKAETRIDPRNVRKHTKNAQTRLSESGTLICPKPKWTVMSPHQQKEI